MTSLATSTIDAQDLHGILGSTAEYALIDVREPRLIAEQGSILLGVSIPLSKLELRVATLVPRRTTAIIVYDNAAEGLADRAGARLRDLGYTDVQVLQGGLGAWADAGYKVQSGGDHVIGQAFGEWVEERYQTPHITVPDFLQKVQAGDDVVLLDSRPITEFENHSLPGGTSIPGAELVYRAREVVTSPDSLVVVNCAGRTRSILGAQVLINAGLPNKVVSLEGGTQSWVLEGHELDHGKRSSAPIPTGEALTAAKASAAYIVDRFGVQTITKDTLDEFRSAADRSLYVLDVRTPEEFEDGHLPGSVSAPSWDVAPWTFRYVATHNSRIVLVDNDLVRASVAASWIVQFGWGEVFVLENALESTALESGPVAPQALGLPDKGFTSITSADLITTLESSDGASILDLQPSPDYRAAHIPGASFAIRSRLADSTEQIPGTGPIVLASSDGKLARYAAVELAAATHRQVQVLDGGTVAWREAGHPVESGNEKWLHEADDVVASGWRETDLERRKEGFRRYLSWELGLVAELDEDDTVPFKNFHAHTAQRTAR